MPHSTWPLPRQRRWMRLPTPESQPETRANVGPMSGLWAWAWLCVTACLCPDMSSVDATKQSVLAADSLVFNRASTGLYLEGLLKKMDVYAKVEGKTTRYPDGAAGMEHVIRGKGNEIGFGAITEVMLNRGRGLTFFGPVPAEVQNYTSYTSYTSYTVAPLAFGKQQVLAQAFVTFLSDPIDKPIFVNAGVAD